jgi:hypothetical protein
VEHIMRGTNKILAGRGERGDAARRSSSVATSLWLHLHFPFFMSLLRHSVFSSIYAT